MFAETRDLILHLFSIYDVMSVITLQGLKANGLPKVCVCIYVQLAATLFSYSLFFIEHLI